MTPSNYQDYIQAACKKIAPTWPLKNMIAVNPYLGLAEKSFNKASKILLERGNIQTTMPLSYYLELYHSSKLKEVYIQKALIKSKLELNSLAEFIEEAKTYLISGEDQLDYHRPNLGVIDIAENISNKKLNDWFIEKLSQWAAAYFDESQALWKTNYDSKNLYTSWKKETEIDLSYEFFGLKDFSFFISVLPDTDSPAHFILKKLRIPEEKIEAYLHGLLLKIPGWASYISGIDWNKGLERKKSTHLEEFLTILLCIEFYFLMHFNPKEIKSIWEIERNKTINISAEKFRELEIKLILQEAFDLQNLEELASQIQKKQLESPNPVRPEIQAIFCIDVRSEVYRRNLEKVNPMIETIGFAGFFGFPIKFLAHGHDRHQAQCPALLAPPFEVKEMTKKEDSTNFKHQIWALWNSFKSGAFSSFGFVSMAGLSFLPKIIRESMAIKKPQKPQFQELDLSSISLEYKIQLAQNAIHGIGLNNHFGRIIFIVGHGSSSANNPQASGLDCGACGGNSGAINALVAQKILNDPQVRTGLTKKGIQIPADTRFIAALHNTTTDEVSILDESILTQTDLEEYQISFAKASGWTKKERIEKFHFRENSFLRRARDWSQVRPEWGLVGCHSFIIGPRHLTKGINLDGRTFLHNYDESKDPTFKVLENILTAPMVVTSWINLQYYASTTDPLHYGAGSKTLHNVIAGLGVVEGAGGDLRTGLAFQSVHNGKEFEHQPYRLKVFVKAPKKAVEDIINQHPDLKNLVENQWIYLTVLEDNKPHLVGINKEIQCFTTAE